MNSNAVGFIKNRKEKISLTQKRVKDILTCVINSYEKIIANGVVFDYSKRDAYKHEDYLTSCLVDDFLQYELESLNFGTTEYSVANIETKEKYLGLDNKIHPDPIDIQIVDSALKKSMGVLDKTYFAIECKRIESGISEYVKDIQKFTERDYSKLRLPFEGQLGFIENPSYTHLKLKDIINKNLSSNSKIETIKQLENHLIKNSFDASYLSEHKKKNKSSFSVFHLFFDYSKIVLN